MRCTVLVFQAAATMLVTLFAADLVVRWTLPHSERLSENFSAAYLQRAVREDHLQEKVLVVGDSALWGYRVKPSEAAVSRLGSSPMPVENFAFEGGSPANAYALLRLMVVQGVRPKA